MRQKMDPTLRAKQFMPFAALTGYEAALRQKDILPSNGGRTPRKSWTTRCGSSGPGIGWRRSIMRKETVWSGPGWCPGSTPTANASGWRVLPSPSPPWDG